MTGAVTELARFRGAFLGLAVGDAVGTTVEFSRPGTFEPVTDMVGGGPFKLPAGAWTDDTSMALCSAYSLLGRNGFDPIDQLQRFVSWYRDGKHSSTGECFDIGNATRASIERFERSGEPFPGDSGTSQAGNGPIMRFAPHALAYAGRPDALDIVAAQTCRATHGAPQAIQTTRYFAWLLNEALSGSDKSTLLTSRWPATEALHRDVEELVGGSFRERQPPQISGDAYIVRTLEAALWALWEHDDFATGLLAVVNLGGDADTTGAVYGQLAGALYGVNAIPEGWRERVFQSEEIVILADRLHALKPSDPAEMPEGSREPSVVHPPHDGFWIEQDRILGGPYPGAKDKAEATQKLTDLLAFGVRAFLDLTEDSEGLVPYSALLGSVASQRGLTGQVTYARVPIRDVSVPSAAQMHTALATLRAMRQHADGLVYVHCWGGVGRTGTVAGCYLIERCAPASEVLARIASRRAHTERAHRVAPETAEQRAFVQAWGPPSILMPWDVPQDDCAYEDINTFAHTFDGYGYFDGADDPRRKEVGEQWLADGSLPDDLDLLRAILFVEFRIDRFTYGDDVIISEPDEEGVMHVLNNPNFEETVTARYRRALVAKIRELAGRQT